MRRGLRAALPRGHSLPQARFDVRHRGMRALLTAFVPGLMAFALLQGQTLAQTLLVAGPPLVFALAAAWRRAPRRLSAVLVALGFMVAAGSAVSAAGGVTEAHFLFFVLIPLLVLYEDWLPFLIAFGFVVVQHLLFGLLAPSLLYTHAGMGEPLKWALVHGGFVAAASVANIVSWRLNEDVRQLEAQAEATLRETFATAPIGMALVGLDGAITHANPALSAFAGTSGDRLIGRPLSALAGPTALDELVAGHREGWEGEIRVPREEGETVYGHAALRLQRDAAGDPLHVIVQVADVTARRHAEQERDRMEIDLRLAQKLEAVGQLAAGIAHEINTPIQYVGDTLRFLDEAFTDLAALVDAYDPLIEQAGLAGAVAAAQERADLDYLRERVPLACARGTEGINRVSTIVQAMRRFAHPPTASMAPVDINDAILTTLIVAASEVKFVADVETELAELPRVIGDAGDLNQVFLNLIVNASHAIADVVGAGGGRGTVRIRTERDGESVVVTVADTGAGIPDDIRERVFDPFFTTKPVGSGTGQGLAIARSIVVDKHAGALTLDSLVGTGTTFTVVLPIGEPVEIDKDVLT